MENDKLVLTASGLITLLSQIDELKDKSIEILETEGKLSLAIENTLYEIEVSDDSEVEVSDETIEAIEEIDQDGYDEFKEEFEGAEVIEGGIIKELVKTLAIGGLVRLTKNAIANA